MAAPRTGLPRANMTIPCGCHFAQRSAGRSTPCNPLRQTPATVRSASTASVTTACSPRRRARPAWHWHAACSRSRRSPMTIRQTITATSFRRVHAVAGAWSSSRPSPAGNSRAPRRNRPRQPGCSRRDPARPKTIAARRIFVSGSARTRPDDDYRPATRSTRPPPSRFASPK